MFWNSNKTLPDMKMKRMYTSVRFTNLFRISLAYYDSSSKFKKDIVLKLMQNITMIEAFSY